MRVLRTRTPGVRCGSLRRVVDNREKEPVPLYARGLMLSSWSELHESAIRSASNVIYRPFTSAGTTQARWNGSARCPRHRRPWQFTFAGAALDPRRVAPAEDDNGLQCDGHGAPE